MAFFSFGKRVKPKKFDYIPMHYDAAKEELESRMADYGQSEISDTELSRNALAPLFLRDCACPEEKPGTPVAQE